jgi:hypothetical protein
MSTYTPPGLELSLAVVLGILLEVVVVFDEAAEFEVFEEEVSLFFRIFVDSDVFEELFCVFKLVGAATETDGLLCSTLIID